MRGPHSADGAGSLRGSVGPPPRRETSIWWPPYGWGEHTGPSLQDQEQLLFLTEVSVFFQCFGSRSLSAELAVGRGQKVVE